MNLYLLRHANADEHSGKLFPDDTKRPLKSEGRRKLHRCAEGLLALKLRFDWIFSSPYRLAAQQGSCTSRNRETK
jgi:phosphohistidine phosphatase SixA